MKLVKQIHHTEVKIHIYESFDENFGQLRYSYEYITESGTLISGLEPNSIIYPDMVSAVTAAHLILPNDLREIMKLEYILL